MSRGFSVFVALTACWVGCAPPASATPPAVEKISTVLPLLAAFSGVFKGELTAAADRPLTWRLSLADHEADGETIRKGELSLTGSDLAVILALTYEPTARRLSWQMREGRVDLATWLPALRTLPELASLLEGVSASGVLLITGEGAWAADAATGELRAEIKDGVVRNEAEGWALEGVALSVGGNAAELVAGNVPINLTVRTISTARFGARALRVNGLMRDFDRIELATTRVEIAGGEVIAEPFAVVLSKPKVSATLVMSKVGLQDLVVFMPETLSEAQGRINGRLHVAWDAEAGVQIGAGGLTLDRSEPTTLRLVSAPGFLTEKVPARLTFLPIGWGWASRLFSSPNEAHKALTEIERGRVKLLVEAMEVRLTPDGDERGRSASVFVQARPEDTRSAIGQVTFTINVAGPLAAVLRLGMEQNLSLKTR